MGRKGERGSFGSLPQFWKYSCDFVFRWLEKLTDVIGVFLIVLFAKARHCRLPWLTVG